MKNWKENASELGQWVQKNRLVQWFQGQDVSIRYLICFIILALVIITWNIINIYFNSFKINDTSAQYLLSALVQSLAAIIAIVVTLTLVAVQLAASVYSPRVIDIFKDDKVMWRLLVVYGLSIFSGLFVLEMIGGTHSNFWCIIVPLEILVLLVYLMGIAAFAGLFWHIRNMIDLLKPENIIKKLSKKITSENVLEFIIPEEKQNKDRTEPVKDDPVQPIADIIHDSVMRYDIATTRVGLKAVTDRAIEIIDSDGQEEISSCFCDHLGRVGRLAVSKMDDESTEEVIRNLGNFGKSTAEKELEGAASAAVWSLVLIGKIAAERGFESETNQAARSLENIGKTAAEKKLEDATFQAVWALGMIECTTEQAARSIGRVGKAASENGLEVATLQAVRSLRTIGLESVVSEAVWSLICVGIVAAKKEGLEYATEEAAQSLAELAISSEENVKTAIEQHRLLLKLKEHDRDSFQKFMDLYDRELEELRTRKPN